jgi:hypothetical protein
MPALLASMCEALSIHNIFLSPQQQQAWRGRGGRKSKILSFHRLTSIAVLGGSVGSVAAWLILLPFLSAEGQSALRLGNKRLVRYARVSRWLFLVPRPPKQIIWTVLGEVFGQRIIT